MTGCVVRDTMVACVMRNIMYGCLTKHFMTGCLGEEYHDRVSEKYHCDWLYGEEYYYQRGEEDCASFRGNERNILTGSY